MSRLRDHLWIWGHPVNSLCGHFGLTDESHMSPAEGAAYLGAKNVFYVPMGRPADMTKLNRCMAGVERVGWSIERAEHVDAILEQSRAFPNIDRGVFDDFFNEENVGSNCAGYTITQLENLRDKLHGEGPRPLGMWMVFYTRQFEMDVGAYMKPFDGVSMWFWTEADVANYEARLQRFLKIADGKKRLIGCYLYNFGEEKQATAQTVRRQLDRGRELLRAGDIEGLILHTNAVGDLGYAAVEEARLWVAEHGDETL